MSQASNVSSKSRGLQLPRISARARSLIPLLGVCLAAGIVVGVASVLTNPLILLALVPVMAVGVWAFRTDERALWLVIVVIGLLPRFAAPVKFGVTPTFLDLALILLAVAWIPRISTHP